MDKLEGILLNQISQLENGMFGIPMTVRFIEIESRMAVAKG